MNGLFTSTGGGLTVTNTTVTGTLLEAEEADYGRLTTQLSDDDLTWEHNNAFDNSLDGDVDHWDDGEGVSAGATLAVDPLYTDQAGGDFTLSASSPLIDAGSADIQDADGSTSDIGAHGGPNAWE
ncbi:MAG: hypothetical protein GY913_10595 [Proteobacteria bacterium]|nr:hypothetical protein [Pseudomonadota bacterium]MCP4917361.1 hypothetical protein [Pseudomonadota bacterium]